LRKVVVLAVLLALPTGCASQAGFGRARVLDPGQAQVTGELETNAFLPHLLPDKVAPIPWVEVGAGYRRGLTPWLEVDGRVWGVALPVLLPGHLNVGGAADAKAQLVRTRRFDLSVAGSLSYDQMQIGGAPWHFFTATAPLLAGFNFGPGERHQLVLGPRVAETIWTSEGQNPIDLTWWGGSIGISLAGKHGVYFMPELVVLYTPVSFNGEVQTSKVGMYSTQLGLGISADL
jgi:hypothetical protein